MHPQLRRYIVTAIALATLPHAVVAEESISYYEHIEPILQAHCVECHRPGQIAPMSLVQFRDVRPWAKSIRKEVLAKRMPPFHADGPRNVFRNDLRLSEDQIELIDRWVQSGAASGQADRSQGVRSWSSDWKLGEPDLTIPMPPYTVKGAGIDHVVVRESEYTFDRDVWVRALDFRPRDLRLVHHAAVYIRRLPNAGSGDGGPEGEHVDATDRFNFLWYTWAPGLQPDPGRVGAARLIERGCKIAVSYHYGPSDVDQIDETEVGIYFANGRIDKTVGMFSFLPVPTPIPPGHENWKLSASKVLPRPDIEISHFWVHMHLRGKSSKYIYHHPDGSKQVLLNVPRYDFHWQPLYYLSEPLKLPPGGRIECISVWDNSVKNPLNPNPEALVGFGNRTVDEMGGGVVFYLEELASDAVVTVENGVPVDDAIAVSRVETPLVAESSSE